MGDKSPKAKNKAKKQDTQNKNLSLVSRICG